MPLASYHLTTFGCQMNKSDSERIDAMLRELGMVRAAREEEADLVLFNSCSVRQSAEDRIYGKLQVLGRLKERRPEMLIAVTGCLPGRDRDGTLRAKMPAVDLFFPIRDLPQLPRWIAELRPELANSADLAEDYLKIRPSYAREAQAYVSIQTGCNKFCTYCVVPFSRGLERNRPVEDVLAEVRERAEAGTVEVCLLGQTVNSYRAPQGSAFSSGNPYKDHFAALLWEVCRIPGVQRVHFTSPHPLHMTDEVIDALTLPQMMDFLLLPVQSGNDEVLRRMNRRYTTAQYLEIVRKVREKKPDIALGTDIIVGFSGETEAQFADTLALYREADFDICYSARYSVRSGTAAALAFKDDVPRAEKKRRWMALQALMEETALRKNQAFVGRTVEVLVEQWQHGVCAGMSRHLKRVAFNSDRDLRGTLVQVRVEKALEWQLSGELVEATHVDTQKLNNSKALKLLNF